MALPLSGLELMALVRAVVADGRVWWVVMRWRYQRDSARTTRVDRRRAVGIIHSLTVRRCDGRGGR
jgi:hypothetical protein